MLVEAMPVVEGLVFVAQGTVTMGSLDIAVWANIERINFTEINKRFHLHTLSVTMVESGVFNPPIYI